jgi:hypothetical protein
MPQRELYLNGPAAKAKLTNDMSPPVGTGLGTGYKRTRAWPVSERQMKNKSNAKKPLARYNVLY